MSNEDQRIDIMMHHLTSLRNDVDEIGAVMKQLASAVTRLALVEERQANTSTAIERLAKSIEKLDERLRVIEIQEPLQKRMSDWVLNIMWAAAAAVVMFVLSKTGFF
jgi:response regulator RpfG family c-di-GMP phosphodiesterase